MLFLVETDACVKTVRAASHEEAFRLVMGDEAVSLNAKFGNEMYFQTAAGKSASVVKRAA